MHNSFALRVAPRITPAHHNGSWELVYELHLVNASKTDLTIERLELLEAPSGRVRADLDSAALTSALGRTERKVPPGVEAIVYMTVEWPSRSATLKHRLTYTADTVTATVEGGEFQVVAEAPLVLGPPLRGGGWTPLYNDAWKTGHRRVIYTTDGTEHIPGRFAIDWMKVAPDGSHAKGDESIPANWYGYGADVLAVADATVAVAMDDIPDPQTVDPRKVVEMQNASGNYIVLALGAGKYAFYEHLESGSIRVHVGDHVRRGKVIAQLGYTGQSTGPHLHFHVADGPMPLNAEGVPYVLNEFETDSSHHLEIPKPMSVVAFP